MPRAPGPRLARLKLLGLLLAVGAPAAALEPGLMRAMVEAACTAPVEVPPTLSGARLLSAANDGQRNDLLEYERQGGDRLLVRRELFAGRVRSVTVEHHAADGRPVALVHAGPDCAPSGGRMVEEQGLERWLRDLGPDLEPVGQPIPINPAPPRGEPRPGVAVALVDSGVNYLLPELAPHLAYGPDGRLQGLDLVDGDERPFDLDQSRNAFFPLRHGTAVASVLAREAPQARILPYRFALGRPGGLARILDHAAAAGARIVLVALGSGSERDWADLPAAAARHPELLLVVSAGNNARDLDQEPVFPAAMDLPGRITVGSARPDGRIAPDSNWGARTVDLLAVGEGVTVTDASGRSGPGFGTSYAAPRIAALAARLLAERPGLDRDGLRTAILARARPLPPHPQGIALARHGWIADPTAP
jgi:hypothetical protein